MSDLRLAELVAALSLATDLGMGSPLEQELRSCLVAVRLGEQVGLGEDELTQVYYLALLRWIGCTSHAHELTRWFDDEIAAHARSLPWDWGRPATLLGDLLRHAGAGRPPLERARTVGGALAGGRGAVGELFRSSCEVGERLAERLGLEVDVQRSLGQLFERWDGRGWPNGLAAEAIARPVRIVQVAQDAVVLHRLGGADAALRALRDRAGGAYDPDAAAALAGSAERLLGEIPSSVWASVIEAEPGPRPTLADEALDRALGAIADFADLKSPYTSGHSSGVAELATRAARAARMPDGDTADLRRAAFVHDLGRTGIPNGIWDRPGPLSDAEWERVRLHPYFVERMLSRPAALERIGALAALHHERLDGSGYHRGAHAAALPPEARILAAADVYHALTEPRPHRPARSAAEAADVLRGEVRAGRLDGEAAELVLGAAGQRRRRRRAWPAGLTAREVEVLRLLARGLTNRQIAAELTISTRTAGHHVQHVYGKIGVSTRAAAALFAMQHDLVGRARR